MNNKILGNKFENDFAELLFAHGWWVHLLKQGCAGQPADVIAVKNGRAFLIDCKECSTGRFPLSRMEDNQICAMDLWVSRGNEEPYYALRYLDEIIMVEDKRLKNLQYTKKSLNWKTVKNIGIPIERWLNERI